MSDSGITFAVDALIASKIIFPNPEHFEVVWRDTFGLGSFYPEVWDKRAVEHGSCYLLGGSWRKGVSAAGEFSVLFTTPVAPYTNNWDAFQSLSRRIAQDGNLIVLEQQLEGWGIKIGGCTWFYPDQFHSLLFGSCLAVLDFYGYGELVPNISEHLQKQAIA